MTERKDGLLLRGRSVVCRPFVASDITDRYVQWLNDPEVNRYSRRRYFSTSPAEARAWLEQLSADQQVLAIRAAADGQHIGNIQFGPIDRIARRAEVRILIGEYSTWGKGYGTEAVYLVMRHLFTSLGLHRAEAGSCNPAFIRLVEKLGWRVEGRLRDHVRLGDGFADWTLLGILQQEFTRRPDLE